MDRNLNSAKRLPWWLIILQVTPLFLQIVGEVVMRVQGIPGDMPELDTDISAKIPDPLYVELNEDK